MKTTWTSPAVTVYGSVEDLTQQTQKDFGANDGFTATITGPNGQVGTVPIGPGNGTGTVLIS